MASSEYLSKRANNSNDSLIHSLYTGIAYLVCVIILVLPYLLNFKYALVFSLFNAFLIILIFNYVICKIKKIKFFKKFLEMFLISSVISLISFLCGTLIKNYFNLNI